MRCTLLREIAERFPMRTHLDLALAVEALTLEKKPSLILNVDGYIAAMLLDMMTDIGYANEDIETMLQA